MIFYFSGTGNSRYAAERLAEILGDDAISIPEALKGPDIAVVSGTAGIVVPVYFLGVPTIVSEFVPKLRIGEDVKVFTVFTYGETPGSASKMLKKELLKFGIRVTHSFEIRMPENYVPRYKVIGKDEQDAMLKAADERIDTIPELLRTDAYSEKRKFSSVVTPLVYRTYTRGRDTKGFTVGSGKCDLCGTCVSVCPIGAIELTGEGPVWIKERCVMCMACVHRCPEEAINIGRSEKNGRYMNPNVRS